jgi:hypothetical protein
VIEDGSLLPLVVYAGDQRRRLGGRFIRLHRSLSLADRIGWLLGSRRALFARVALVDDVRRRLFDRRSRVGPRAAIVAASTVTWIRRVERADTRLVPRTIGRAKRHSTVAAQICKYRSSSFSCAPAQTHDCRRRFISRFLDGQSSQKLFASLPRAVTHDWRSI